MKREKLSVRSFHSQLQDKKQKEQTLFAVLGSLTTIKDTRKVASLDSPSPLGSWSGWSM